MKQLDLEFQELPYSVEEALNRLRINIKFCGKHTKKILITSSVPNEGKSSISVYLWKMLAEAGFPTVFVDTDLRKSVIKERHKVEFGEDDMGVGHYIAGLVEYEDVIYKTNVENGYIVPCTNLLENPSALFEDSHFRELLDKLAEDYRYVIVDSPPLANVADAALIASMCDGTILVIREGETPRKIIRQSIQQLEQVNSKLLGVVLNRVRTDTYASKKYYGKYYGKGYYGHYGPKED